MAWAWSLTQRSGIFSNDGFAPEKDVKIFPVPVVGTVMCYCVTVDLINQRFELFLCVVLLLDDGLALLMPSMANNHLRVLI